MPVGIKTVKIKVLADGKGVKPGADEAAKGLEGFSSKLEGIGSTIGSTVTKFAGIGLAIGSVGEIFSNAFEQINIENTLKAKLGVGTKIASDAAASVADVYKAGIGDSFDGVADAVDAVASNLNGLTDTSVDALNRLTPIAIGLQKVYGVDVQEQLRAVSQLLRTGLVKDAQSGFDLIAVAEQKFGAGAEDILDTFNEYSVQFKKIGVDGPEALGLINQLMQGGARNTDLAADALKEFAIRAVDGSATTIAAYQALNLDVNKTTEDMAKGGPVAQATFTKIVDALKSVKDPAKQSQIAVELFGTQAEDLGSALYNLDATKATSTLGDFAGAAQKAADAVNKGPQQVISEFSRTLQDFATNVIGTYVIPAIQAVANWIESVLVPAFQAVETWLEQHIYPAIITVFGWLQQNVFPIVQGIADIFARMWQSVTEIWDQAAPYFAAVWNSIVAFVQPIIDQFNQVISNIWEQMKGPIEDIKNFITEHWDTIKLVLEGVMIGIAASIAVFLVIVALIGAAFGAIAITISVAVQYIVESIDLAGQVIGWLWAQWNFALNSIGNAVRSAGLVISTVWNAITGALNDALNRARSQWDGFIGVLQNIAGRIGGIFSGIWSGITNGLKSGLNAAIGIINGAINALNAVTSVVHVPAIPNIPYLANGGTAFANNSYVVGEKGPEIFTPGRTGRVTSNDQSFGSSDNPINVQVYIGDKELTDMVDTRVRVNNRQVKRDVRSGSTA